MMLLQRAGVEKNPGPEILIGEEDEKPPDK